MELLPLAYIFIGFFILIFFIDKVMFDYHNKPKERKLKFKIGDRVRCYSSTIDNQDPDISAGVIDIIFDDGLYGVCRDDRSNHNVFHEKQLRKLVKKAK